jgi:predicted ferric reductase
MIALSTPVLWYLSRASGIVSLLLFTGVMALGIMTATRVGGRPLPRFAVAELHRRLALLAVVFLAIHVGSTALDSYVNISFLAIVVPGLSHYKAFDVALGALAIDLLLAVVITSLLRQRISASAWRMIHWISYLSWPIALLHAFLIGTDVRYSWMDLLLVGCLAVVAAAVVWRIWARPHPSGALTAVPRARGRVQAPSAQRPTPAVQSAPTKPIASSRRGR